MSPVAVARFVKSVLMFPVAVARLAITDVREPVVAERLVMSVLMFPLNVL